MSTERWFARPAAALQPYIDRYWGWEGDVPLPPCILPGTGAECSFYYRNPPRLDGQAAHRSMLIAPRSQPIAVGTEGGVGFVAVRFRAGRLRHLCARPLAEIHDQQWSLHALWGDAALRLEDALTMVQRADVWVRRLDAFFLAQLAQYHDPASAPFDAALDYLYYRPATTQDALADRCGWTRRHITRKFNDYYGITPKHFSRLARFSHTMRALALEPCARTLDVALQMGYYDQAHFIHETRELTGFAPGSILPWLQSGSHFYNPPSRPIE